MCSAYCDGGRPGGMHIPDPASGRLRHTSGRNRHSSAHRRSEDGEPWEGLSARIAPRARLDRSGTPFAKCLTTKSLAPAGSTSCSSTTCPLARSMFRTRSASWKDWRQSFSAGIGHSTSPVEARGDRGRDRYCVVAPRRSMANNSLCTSAAVWIARCSKRHRRGREFMHRRDGVSTSMDSREARESVRISHSPEDTPCS